MANILFVNACVRPNSRTLELAECVLSHLQGELVEYDLKTACLTPIDMDAMEMRKKAVQDPEADPDVLAPARQFVQADVIVIAAPYWDLMFPAVLKVYLENVSVAGVSFVYTPQGKLKGLCKAKELYYITTAGGFIGENDYGFAYIKALAQNLFGIRNVRCFSAEGLDISAQLAKESMRKAKENIDLIMKDQHFE